MLERIIKASTPEPNDSLPVVLDPFCGCATTCVSVEKLGRAWIGIDISFKAYELVKERLNTTTKETTGLLDWSEEIITTTTVPTRTDKNGVTDKGNYLYIISNEHSKGFYKIGITTDVDKRLKSYQTSDPLRGVAFQKQTPYYRELEKHVLEHFKDDCLNEWIHMDIEKIKQVIENYEKECRTKR